MAKHRVPEKRRTSKALVVAATAAGLSGGLVLGHATDRTLANIDVDLSAVIGVGGASNPTSDRVPPKLSGAYTTDVYPTYGNRYIGIQYPASLAFQTSIDDGVPKLTDEVAGDTDAKTRVVSYSEGTLVAEQVKRNLAAGDPEDPLYEDKLDFVFIASPYVPNGGLFARFPGFRVPGLLPEFGPAEATGYDSTYVYNEYDGISDFPAYFNPLSIANALLGIRYAHPDQYYDPPVDPDALVEGQGKFTTTVPNGADGNDTYVLIYNPHLPLLAPIREVASAIQLTPLTEPMLAAFEPLLRVMVDAGYTDRENLNPGTPTPFSLITPPATIVDALAKVPGAVTQGVGDATSQTPGLSTLSVPDGSASRQAAADAPDASAVTSSNQDSLTAGDAQGTKPNTPTPKTAPKPITKPKPGNLFNDVATAVGQILHPTKVKDGNLVKPTTTSGSPSTDGSQNTGGSTSSTTPGDPSPAGSGTPDAAPGGSADQGADKAAKRSTLRSVHFKKISRNY